MDFGAVVVVAPGGVVVVVGDWPGGLSEGSSDSAWLRMSWSVLARSEAREPRPPFAHKSWGDNESGPALAHRA